MTNLFRNAQVNLNWHNSRPSSINIAYNFSLYDLPAYLSNLSQDDMKRRKSVCHGIFCLQEKYMYLACLKKIAFSVNEYNLRKVSSKRKAIS